MDNLTVSRRSIVAGLVGAALVPRSGWAEAAYPNHPVRIVVPFAPGGGADIVSRLLQPHLQQRLGQPFVVENRAGAAGRIGTALVAKADPDGHTLLTTTESSMVIAPHTGAVLGYDPLKDFAPVSLLTRNTVVLVVHPSLPAKTLAEYIALAKAGPGKLFYGSSGVGGPNHLAGEVFNRMAGVNIVHVPFAGTGAALPAVMGNQVGAMWGFTAGLIPFIRDGKLRALAVSSKDRSPALPDVPTVAEAGVPGYEQTSWIGMLAPGATPPATIETLWNAVSAAMKDSKVRETLVNGGTDIMVSRPDEFRQVIASDYAKYAKLADLFKTIK
jgi:tripartite-type tricarboxylate transporter receptor subunit TctC